MSADERISDVRKEKPKVYLKRITFNDDTDLQLKRNSIIVFTGANNCGKSQVLKDIELCFDKSTHKSKIVVKESECEYLGSIDEGSFIKEHFIINKQGMYQPLGLSASYSNEVLNILVLCQDLVQVKMRFSSS